MPHPYTQRDYARIGFGVTRLGFVARLSYGQDEQDNAQDKLERIEVTAQKRTQSMASRCACCISAFDGKRLEELGLSELDMISDLTPGLVIQELRLLVTNAL